MPLVFARLFVCAAILLTAAGAAAFLDRDGNGYGDVWELVHGGTGVSGSDEDGDGATLAEEHVAGTDPRSRTSVLRLEELSFPEPGAVRLRWTAVPGKRYRILASRDLRDWVQAGPPRIATGAALEVTLTLSSTFATGGLSFSRWDDLSGSVGVTTLAAYATSGNPAPSASGLLPRLDVPPSSPNRNAFGLWIRGWLVPPATGDYTFQIASDDQSELWLSTDASTSNRRRIAYVDGWTTRYAWTKYTSQTSAPIRLDASVPRYIEVFLREWWGGDHVAVRWFGPGLDPAGEILDSAYLATSPESLASVIGAGPMHFRIEVSDTDTDADGVTDYEERIARLDPENPTTTPRVADRDALLAALVAPSVVTVGASAPRAYERGAASAVVTFFRSGGLRPLEVLYAVSGTALPVLDYVPLPGRVSFAAGQAAVRVEIVPLADDRIEPAESVQLHALPAADYELGTPAAATVSIDDAPDVIYVAHLRPDSGYRSGGWGTASLRVAGNGLFAQAAVSFGGLRSRQIGSELYVSSTGVGGLAVLSFPVGQVASRRWGFESAAGMDSGQLRAALAEGRLWARVNTERVPAGEIFGRFVPAPAFQQMPAPQPAPGYDPVARTEAEAARFLTQATFGPTSAGIADLRGRTYAAWIDEQLSRPPTYHLPYVRARRAELLARSGGDDDGWQTPRQEAWWQAALTAPDQLRQRMAFALSQILVVSDIGVLDVQHEGVTTYYDLLVAHAFGNYRDLLKAVTLSPAMGQYLSMMRNRKPDPVTGSEPDENYAREVMQLFSIGLNELHPDGTLRLDDEGRPIPTYTQEDIVGLAHVFTGWGPHYDPADPPRWSNGSVASPRDWFLWGLDEKRSMSFFEEFHDKRDRRIVGGRVISGSLSGPQRLDAALDAIFRHPNTGPFLARQLIQRFVTSNPSPGYVYRVASVFADNGAGVRGDLGAVIRAVLLDGEARNAAVAEDVGFGRLREPLLRMSHLLRAHNARPPLAGDSRFFLDLQYMMPHQAALKSPSVFNFFQPVYAQPGPIAAAGLLSPEFQIASETTIVNQTNNQDTALLWGLWTRESQVGSNYFPVRLDLSPEVAILSGPYASARAAQSALIDHLNLRLLGGRLSPGLRAELLGFFADLPTWFGSGADAQRWRAAVAIWIVVSSPEYAVER